MVYAPRGDGSKSEGMKVLILGGSGMLGHKLWQSLSKRFDALVTFRKSVEHYLSLGVFDPARAVTDVSAENFESIQKALATVRPDVVVNCIGIVKQDAAAKNAYQSILVNALFPHQLAHACRTIDARLIHLSTDCVFSGRQGKYKESDTSDAEDIYGRTKWLGELSYEHCLTIRTSMVGRELTGSHGLVEWFLSQRGKTVRGFQQAIFSGLTTNALSDTIGSLIADNNKLNGVWHVAGNSINKFDLLSLVKNAFRVNVEIEPDQTFVCDRSLDDYRFRSVTGFQPPSWEQMIEEMASDSTRYEQIRRTHAGR